MRVNKNQKGITIAETMIVLGVTSVMLMATITLISGQIERYRFRSTVLTAEQQIRDALNDAADGNFGEAADTSGYGSCDDNSASKVGDSKECYYVGKEFTIDTSAPAIRISSIYLDKPPRTNVKLTSPVSSVLPGYVDYSIVGGGDNKFRVFLVGSNGWEIGGGVNPRYTTSSANGIAALRFFPAGLTPTEICLESGSRNAKITIGGENGSVTTKTEYVPSC